MKTLTLEQANRDIAEFVEILCQCERKIVSLTTGICAACRKSANTPNFFSADAHGLCAKVKEKLWEISGSIQTEHIRCMEPHVPYWRSWVLSHDPAYGPTEPYAVALLTLRVIHGEDCEVWVELPEPWRGDRGGSK